MHVTLRHLSCVRSFIAHKALYWLVSTLSLLNHPIAAFVPAPVPAAILGVQFSVLIRGCAVGAENLIGQCMPHLPRVVLKVVKLIGVISGKKKNKWVLELTIFSWPTVTWPKEKNNVTTPGIIIKIHCLMLHFYGSSLKTLNNTNIQGKNNRVAHETAVKPHKKTLMLYQVKKPQEQNKCNNKVARS